MILAAVSHLVFSVIVSRHGVRSITSTPAVYSWADWAPVKPGYLTQHGYDLVTYIGKYHKDTNASIDCSRKNVFVYADIDQRTLETARAYVQGMCGSPSAIPIYHDLETAEGTNDPIFNAQDWVASRGLASPMDSEAAVLNVVGTPVTGYVSQHASDFNALQDMMNARCAAECPAISMTHSSIVSKNGLSELNGPVKTASTYAENIFLEAAECRPLTNINLEAAMRLHVLAYDFNSRNEYNSGVRGANLLAHIVGLLLSKAGIAWPYVETPDVKNDAVAFISGHDTQLGALGGILDAHWPLANGLVPDDMPPGGALVFDLYDTGGEYTVRLRFVYETLAQLMSKAPIKDGVVSVPVSCNRFGSGPCNVRLYDLDAFTGLYLGKGANTAAFSPTRGGDNGYIKYAWTPMTDAPVALAPLTDPKWSQCR